MNRVQFDFVTRWQDKVFTTATPLSCMHHLKEEVDELITEIEAGKVDRKELADCFLLLFAVCNKAGLTYDDVVDVINEKMSENLKRKWGEPNEKGYVKHIHVSNRTEIVKCDTCTTEFEIDSQLIREVNQCDHCLFDI